jgi:putative ABC transport system ATP-binding protein
MRDGKLMTDSPIIQARHLHRVFQTAGGDIHAVNDVSLDIHPYTTTAVIGPSGAGKTTLLNLLSGLDEPTQGEVWIEGQSLYALSDRERRSLRRDCFGFVFQNFGLLSLLSAAENVSIPLRMQQIDHGEIDQRATQALEWVGLRDRRDHRPYELSGGEQQRVAVARALVARPKFIVADEPTGQLDSSTGKLVLNIMRRLADEHDITMIIVTHDPQAIEVADTVHELRDGQLVDSVAAGRD